MQPSEAHLAATATAGRPTGRLDRLLRAMSAFTMIMTLPQAWAVWRGGNAGGVSLASWAAYLFASCLWLVYGLRKRDPTIYLACIGWIVLDAAIVIGVVVHR
jgi:uncharacterized protein with PQ loop repeat